MAEISLTRGLFALVDDADVEVLSRFRWHAVEVSPGKIYARARIEGRNVYMHRWLLADPIGRDVDHVDNCGLNNQRANLRAVPHAANVRKATQVHANKTSQFRGVCFVPRTPNEKPWLAQLKVNGVKVLYRRFRTEEEAARVYDVVAREFHGSFATLNFPL